MLPRFPSIIILALAGLACGLPSRADAERIVWSEVDDIANTDMDTIQDANNSYSFERQRATDEIAYRKAIKAELNDITNNVSRLGSLPRSNH